MAITNGPNVRRASSSTTVPQIRIPRQYDDSDSNALSKVRLNYPILIFGSVGIAVLIFWYREKTKNIYEGVPVLTVSPSSDADMSNIANIQHLLDFDVSILDTRVNSLN